MNNKIRPIGHDGTIHTHHDNIPDYAVSPTVRSARSGYWSKPSTWENGKAPSDNDVIVIQAGHKVTYDLKVSSNFKTISVLTNGKMVFHTGMPTQLKVVTLMVMPDGHLEIGSKYSPIKPGCRAEVIFLDRPIDMVFDPKQYGHGLVALGNVFMHGETKTTEASKLRLLTEPHIGETVVKMVKTPVAWKVGDRVVIPPTEPVHSFGLKGGPIDTEEFSIKSIVGNTITLDKPFGSNHLGAYDVDGKLKFLPHIVNLTRNVILRSDKSAEVPAHTLFTGRGDVDIRFVEFDWLGRTTGKPIGPGNQVGRYAVHFHHLIGPVNPTNVGYQFKFIGNSLNGGKKWAIDIHGSHYGIVQSNNIYNFQSAGIATEDGTESYNLIDNNIIVKIDGLGEELSDSFWFAGPLNYISNNVGAAAYNSNYLGHAYHLDLLRSGDGTNSPKPYPLFRGADHDQMEMKPWGRLSFLDFTNNEGYCLDKCLSLDHYTGPGKFGLFKINALKAWGLWSGASSCYGGSTPVVFTDLIVRKYATSGFFQPNWENGIILRNADIQSSYSYIGMNSVGVLFTGGVVRNGSVTIENSYLNNTYNVINHLGQGSGTATAYNQYSKNMNIKNVRFENPPGGTPHKLTLEYRGFDSTSRVPMIPNIIYMDDLQVFWKEQSPDRIAPYIGDIESGSGYGRIASPEPNLTNEQCMEKYGLAVGAALATCKTEYPDVVNAYVCARQPGPKIYDVSVVRSGNTATVSWKTDKRANGRVDYGPSEEYETTYWTGPTSDNLMKTEHSLTLTLESSASKILIMSRDINGNDSSFSTEIL